MKRLLAISWEMPPLSGPRAVQITRTLMALGSFGWQSRVICFDAQSRRYQQDYAVAPAQLEGGGVRLLPVRSAEEWLLFRALWRIVPPLKHLPDEKSVWIPSAIAEGRRALREEPADIIVSFAQPWSDHLVALSLHRETALPWVAHFSDPWVDSPYQSGTSWTRRRAAAMERDVVESATMLVFVNRQTLDRVMQKYPAEWRERAHVIPQGHLGAATRCEDARRSGPMRVVYTGRFYDGIRTPESFLRAIAEADRSTSLEDRLEVEFVGAGMDKYHRLVDELGLTKIVKWAGRVSPDQARQRASEADVLLVIDAPSSTGPSLFLPSKLIDYLPLAKTILAITPRHGPVADIISELGYVAVDPSDTSALATALLSLVEAHESHGLTPSASHPAVAAAYEIRETTARFDRVLNLARQSA